MSSVVLAYLQRSFFWCLLGRCQSSCSGLPLPLYLNYCFNIQGNIFNLLVAVMPGENKTFSGSAWLALDEGWASYREGLENGAKRQAIVPLNAIPSITFFALSNDYMYRHGLCSSVCDFRGRSFQNSSCRCFSPSFVAPHCLLDLLVGKKLQQCSNIRTLRKTSGCYRALAQKIA